MIESMDITVSDVLWFRTVIVEISITRDWNESAVPLLAKYIRKNRTIHVGTENLDSV